MIKSFKILRQQKFSILCYIGLIWILSSCQSYNHELITHEELLAHGFYLYGLPNQTVEQSNWHQEIRFRSYDAHCRNLDTIEFYNPLRITYKDSSMLHILTVTISPFEPHWDTTAKDITVIKIEVEWAKDGKLQYYVTGETNAYILLIDTFGNAVTITSQLEVRDLIELIEQLKYVGSEKSTNPWEVACNAN